MGLRFKYVVPVFLLVATSAVLWSAFAPEPWLESIRGFVRADQMPISKPLPPKERVEGRTPNEVVDEIWRMATQGQLLKPEGWRLAGGFFTEPRPFPANEKILVVGNEWGPAYEMRTDGNSKEIVVGYWDAGSVDTNLRYTPPARTGFVKTAFAYMLVTAPSYLMMYGPDGKTLVEKRPSGSRVWLIKGAQGQRLTTVNTAIRYVLQMRQETSDQAIKGNANQTLTQLLRFR